MTSRFPNICMGCQRLHRDNDRTDELMTCTAFPNGIPGEITSGLNDHTDFFPGDGGLKFVEDPERVDMVNLYYDWINSPEGDVWKQWMADILEEARQSGQTGDQQPGGGGTITEA